MPVERGGFCTAPGCGKCCEVLRFQVPAEYRTNVKLRQFYETRGVSFQQADGATFALINLSCPHLQQDGMCGIYGQPERPQICDEWPYQPWDLLPVADVCTYSFSEVTDDVRT